MPPGTLPEPVALYSDHPNDGGRLEQAAPLLVARLQHLQWRLWGHHLLWGSFLGLLWAVAGLALALGLWQGGWLDGIWPARALRHADWTWLVPFAMAAAGAAGLVGAVGSWIEGLRQQRFTLSRAAAWLDQQTATGGLFLATVEVWARSGSGTDHGLSPVWASLASTSNSRLRSARGSGAAVRVHLPIPFPRLALTTAAAAGLGLLAGYGLATHSPSSSTPSGTPATVARTTVSPRVQAAFDALWQEANRLEQQARTPSAQKAAEQLRAAAAELAAQGEAGFPGAMERIYQAYNDALATAYAPLAPDPLGSVGMEANGGPAAPGGVPGGRGATSPTDSPGAAEWLQGLASVAQQVVALAQPGSPAGPGTGDSNSRFLADLPQPSAESLATTLPSPDALGSNPADAGAPNAGQPSSPGSPPASGFRPPGLRPSPWAEQPTAVGSPPAAGTESGFAPSLGHQGTPPPGDGEGGSSSSRDQLAQPGQSGQAGHGDDPNRWRNQTSVPAVPGTPSWLPGQAQPGPLWAGTSPNLPQQAPAGSTQRVAASGSPEAVASEELPASYRQWIARYFSAPAPSS